MLEPKARRRKRQFRRVKIVAPPDRDGKLVYVHVDTLPRGLRVGIGRIAKDNRCTHMKISCLATAITLATMTLLGCREGTTTVQPDASVRPDAFEPQGTWLYLGPWDGEHWLKISNASVVYTAVDGTWSSNWTIKDYDNGLHHFQLVFESGTGTYSPTGQNLSGTYVLSGTILTVQVADGLGLYSPVTSPGSCMMDGGPDRIPNCGIYYLNAQ
jgi:hypothetical protein